MQKPKLITLCGIPGSGKTSVRHKFKSKEWAVCSSDDLIPLDENGNRIYNPETLNASWSQVWRDFGRNMSAQRNIILDNTFIRSQERNCVCNIARGLNYYTVLIWICTPLVDCLVNNAHRRHPVPTKVLKDKYRSFQKPTYKEGWDKIVSIRDIDFGLVWEPWSNTFIPIEEYCFEDY